jgi:hypothetical protein
MNVFVSRNSTEQQSDKSVYFSHTTPRQALDLDSHAAGKDVGAVAEALERGRSGEQKPRKEVTAAIPGEARQGTVVKDKALLEAATALKKEESLRGMVAGATKPLLHHKLNEQDMQPDDKAGDQDSNKQQHYSPTPNTNHDSIQQDLHSTHSTVPRMVTAVPRMVTAATTAADKTLLEAATVHAKEEEEEMGVRGMVADYRYQAVEERDSSKVCALQHSTRETVDSSRYKQTLLR